MGSTPPTLPRFPSFSDLGSILPPVEDEHDVWGSLVSATPPPPPSQPPYDESPAPLPPPVSSQSPPLSPYSPHLLADLDPFAPTPPLPASPPPTKPSPKHTPPRLNLGITLGSTTKPASKLELIPDSDASDSPSPTSSFVVIPPPPTPTKSSPPARPRTPPPVPPAPPRQTSVKPKPSVSLVPGGRSSPTASGSGGGTGPGGGTFFGDMFRSFSDSPTKRPVPSEEKASIQASYDEKERRAAPPPPPSQPSISPSSSTSNLNPISSIANAFRSATTSRPSSRGNTPPPGSSSAAAAAAGEKGASLEVGSRVREKGSKLKGKEGEVEVTFDFARFLEQMRHRSAEPVAKYLRSFLKEFSRKPPVTTTDQIRVINDFLDFIAGKMRAVDPWKSMVMDLDAERGEAEYDMATEAMEKLVMNRLWHLTFSPAVDLNSLPGHPPTDDLERDNVLSQRIRLFAWVTPANLDLNIKPLPPTAPSSPNPNSSSLPSSPLLGSGGSDGGTDSDGGGDMEKTARERAEREAKQTQNFLLFARRELHKMNQYKSPRDKLICILNACKVIFGLIRHVSSEEGADAFVPFLIYVVLKANPDHLVSNIQYIQRFRNPEKLSGEGGYYLSSLNGAISFIETMDSSSLSNITQEEFEHHVEIAIQNLPVDPSDSSLRLARTPTDSTTSFAAAQQRAPEPPLSTPADISRVVNANVDGVGEGEGEGDEASPKLIQQPGGVPPPGGGGGTRGFFARGTDSVERIVSKPLGAIGRIFDQLEALAGDGDGGTAVGTTQPGSSGTGTRAAGGGGGAQGGSRPGQPRRAHSSYSSGGGNALMGDGGAAAAAKDDPHAGLYVSDRMSAGQVTEEIDRQHEQKRLATLETLKGIFPQLEDEVLEMVLLSNGGDMARTIDALLEMS